jgi:cell division protein FtsI/penicillin-binding protein 2
MNVTIRHLTNAFILLLLAISGVAAYVQIGNTAPLGGQELVGSQYETLARKCPPVDKPLRGRILDRHGNVIAATVSDGPKDNFPCGYHRVYASWAINAGLAPLIGYFTYNHGSAGVEASYDDYLSGSKLLGTAGPSDIYRDTYNKLIHRQQLGADLYLTIDKNVQETANK